MTKETIDIVNRQRSYAIYKCGSAEAAEDLMQEVFYKLLQKEVKLNSMNADEKLKYIVTCIRNMAIDSTRRRTSKHRPWGIDKYPEDWEANAPAVMPDVFARLEIKEVQKVAQRRPICETILKYAEGYKNSEIAAAEGVSVNTVLGRCRYARAYLKEQLQ